MKKMDALLSSHQKFDKYIEEQNKMTNSLETNMKSIENQIGQMAQELYRKLHVT